VAISIDIGSSVLGWGTSRGFINRMTDSMSPKEKSLSTTTQDSLGGELVTGVTEGRPRTVTTNSI
jgi:hypothetical protein